MKTALVGKWGFGADRMHSGILGIAMLVFIAAHLAETLKQAINKLLL